MQSVGTRHHRCRVRTPQSPCEEHLERGASEIDCAKHHDPIANHRRTLATQPKLVIDPSSEPLEADVPPFAETFRLELAELGAYAVTQIAVKDALGDVRATYNAALQPVYGIPVGGASKVEVSTNHPGTLARAVFHLSL